MNDFIASKLKCISWASLLCVWGGGSRYGLSARFRCCSLILDRGRPRGGSLHILVRAAPPSFRVAPLSSSHQTKSGGKSRREQEDGSKTHSGALGRLCARSYFAICQTTWMRNRHLHAGMPTSHQPINEEKASNGLDFLLILIINIIE